MTKHARFSLLPSFIIFSAALLAGCNDQGDTQAHAGEPQVTVHVVETAPLAVTTELPGRTSAGPLSTYCVYQSHLTHQRAYRKI
ncbi:transmembrane protein affecting septum formation and cell membrane permeability [Salmonella enterica subsp. enterica serovar Uganda str. R8-3404]|uniref:Transmembrane protein affecting septum formation and cell membrane permeability n=1 Tax=Salmonella enterica subsp. enterica serovar Uganda str. R8-3404 TaxID=913083 RepID=A0A6C8GXN0_SALET|nr:transmembrane protein affecting septum formation and cell membrane permeability [Salmonella enterica subsp. enterica serovar Uganda str. R8-3404]